jgi:hypothetical protein
MCVMPVIPLISRQFEAIGSWAGLALAIKLHRISNSILVVITRTDDASIPAANSLIIAQKVSRSWLVQINGGGGRHGLMY